VPDSHRTLRRPPADAGIPEVALYHRTVAAALEAIGVDYDEEFVVVPARNFHSQTEMDTSLGPFAKDSETSRQAAIDNYPRKGSQREKILTVFAAQIPKTDGDGGLTTERHGYTRDDLERLTNLSGNAIRPRVKELLDGGYLEETEETRPTRAGSAATVLQITEDGKRVFLPQTSTHDHEP
jgi:hypothetical protein